MDMISPRPLKEIPQTPISHHPLSLKSLHHLPVVVTPLVLLLLHFPHERTLKILMTRHRTRARTLASQIRNQRVKNRIMQHFDLVPLSVIPEHAPNDPRVEVHTHSHTAAEQVG